MERRGQHEETIGLGRNSRLLAEIESIRHCAHHAPYRSVCAAYFNKRSPDFKHTDTCEGLWLDCSPAWVLPKLPPATKPKQDGVVGKRDTFLSYDFEEAI
ncbi:hypothetical protein HHK36_009215 [Tetracentron sinense]|uniref:Uncharacterized protein n=1 Tax=Tetracentron sinense TaxID=13715 RepID=A0A834ZKT7_TETSI|nr:hypothetical protein HHK36_009215 [Tetracentron sinense]